MWSGVVGLRRAFLLSVTVLMLLATLEVETMGWGINTECCKRVKGYRRHDIGGIQSCFEQIPRTGCMKQAFVIFNDKDEKFCVKPTPPWLSKLLSEGRLECPPDISLRLLALEEEQDEK